MPSYKTARDAQDIRWALTEIFRTLKDPRVAGMLSIVSLDLARDQSLCKVYISSLEGMERTKAAVTCLNAAAGYIRRELGARMSMRHTPQLQFIADDGIEHSADINRILKDL